MTQQDRDRLVALKKAKKGLITQRQAAEEIGQSERHVRRLLKRLKSKGDKALVHALRGRPSNRKLDEKTKQKAVEILGREVYHGFGPTPAAEYLANTHDIHAGRETVRTWMIEGKLYILHVPILWWCLRRSMEFPPLLYVTIVIAILAAAYGLFEEPATRYLRQSSATLRANPLRPCRGAETATRSDSAAQGKARVSPGARTPPKADCQERPGNQ